MTTPIKKRTHQETGSPEAPATPSTPIDKKTSGVVRSIIINESLSRRSPRTPPKCSLNTNATLPVTTPPQTPEAAARGSSSTSFHTPEPKRTIAAPPKPSKKPKQIENDEVFAKQCYGEKKPVTVDATQIKETIEFLRSYLPNRSIPEYYRLPSGRHVLAIQQPDPETSSCGPGCALMIAADHQKVELAFSEKKFKQWYGETKITNAKNLLHGFHMLKISCEVFQFTTDKDYSLSQEDAKHYKVKHGKNSKDAIEFMKNVIDRTKHSLITGITHPKLDGHWVIIDEFYEGNIYGRCPRFGTAFCISESKLAEWLFDQPDDPEIVQSMIIFP
jgi:hypothetical protein